MIKRIESPQNSFIKSIIQLQEKSRNRRQSGTFVIEGLREIELAIKGGYQLTTLLYQTDIISKDQLAPHLSHKTELIEISKEVYQKLAYRDTTEGVLAIAETKSLNLEDLKLSDTPIILVAEATEKPGNIGAILRTADAANIDAVIIANPKSDLYNPNVIRSSVGCVFTNQIAMASTEETIEYLKAKNINIYCATLQDSTSYHTRDYTQPTAFVVGTEATGLTQPWRNASTKNIIIPMSGVIDSMNVSVAASILLFEAKRQRDFK
ncbi:TrmH family RNA methyltransferase [Myroides pelagicus]|uniref:RNA methyltransferase n=1 Tax=Myroides pelagicus TaxID=270914 RepID=A0A7K1GPI6_9FLAO|nr:RNA methyltransferase [Myroides pelagicus]MEC4114691.1 RNA methyltransferase [Myroides pelagicus]MTH30469.1 RNA methyltransferase [Myroides pelagicus]